MPLPVRRRYIVSRITFNFKSPRRPGNPADGVVRTGAPGGVKPGGRGPHMTAPRDMAQNFSPLRGIILVRHHASPCEAFRISRHLIEFDLEAGALAP